MFFFLFITDISPTKWKSSGSVWSLLNAARERLWAYKCALKRGKRNLKLSYWIDWTFMKLKCALPSSPSHVEMTSRHLRRPKWNTAVRIPTLQSGVELLPCRHSSVVKPLMNRAGGFISQLKTFLCLFRLYCYAAHLFYKVAYLAISISSPKKKKSLVS